MNAIREVQRQIKFNPYTDWSQTLADLVISLESDTPFQLERLYTLDLHTFDLALKVIEEWRLDRYYARKMKLVDMSLLAKALGKEPLHGAIDLSM
ncbi:hypothetical protein [Pseudorhodoferax sp.]|uniref:hypothetical protein n=1 Tax=Pseudorhodoferax sp. TaxID=1993553 RepID=UPI002DD6A4FA|nr:hypothetical protein [Pseudorhodoferax sp.]